MKSAMTTVGLLLALLCGACQAPAKGYRAVADSELPLHRPTGITFPATAGTLQRQWVHEKLDDPKSIRAGYGVAAWLDVTPSRGTATAKLESMKRSILVRHSDTAVTRPAAAVRGLFAGWETAVLENHAMLAETAANPEDQPRRDFLAARRCGRYMLSVRAWSLDPGDTEQLKRVGQAAREIFADQCRPGSSA